MKKIKISKIEKKVDKTIKKQEKTETNSKINNFEDFSIKNKQGDSIFYLKENPKKKTEKKSEELSHEIISEARDNLGEEPLPMEEIEKQIDEIIKNPRKKTGKLKIKFGKKKEDTSDETETPGETNTEQKITEETPYEAENISETKTEQPFDLEPKVEIKQTEEKPPSELEKPEETMPTPEPEIKQEEPPVEEHLIEEESPTETSEKTVFEITKEEPEKLKEKPFEETFPQPEIKELQQTEEKTEENFKPTKTPEINEQEEKPKKFGFLKKKKPSEDKETKEKILSIEPETNEEESPEQNISQPEKTKKIRFFKKKKQPSDKEIKDYLPSSEPASSQERKDTTEKPGFLKKKKSSEEKEIQDLMQKYDGKLIFSDTMSSEEDFVQEDNDAKILDEKIASTSTENQSNPEDIGESKAIELSKKHGLFGKKKIPSSKTRKPIEEKQEDQKEKKSFSDLKFRVDNLPIAPDKSEADLLDEKIKETYTEDSVDENEKEAEKKAMELAQEHIKDSPLLTIEKETTTEEDEENSNEAFDSFLEESELKDEEHVFFDETDHGKSQEGWSPQTADKKKTTTPLSGQPEIDPDLKGVQDIELPKELLQNKSVKLSDLGFSENEWEELEFYPLHEPFAYVEVLREKESLDKCYFLVEIELTDSEKEAMNFILETMTKLTIDTAELEETGDDTYLADRIDEVLQSYDVRISDESKHKIFYYIGKNSLGLGKIDPLLKDPNIEDISCDGANVPIFLYHRKYGSVRSNIEFDNEEQLSSFIFKLAQKCGKHVSIAEPMLDATMPDGSRVQMTLSDEVTAKGSTFTIRKFREDPFSPPDLVEFNTMSSEMIAYMWIAVENGINTLFAGGTASGKTTALNALSLFIPRESKIVSIEETREINLPHPNWIPGVARSGFGEVVADKMVGEIDMYDLMKAALRQRPEYILVGEIRGKEAYVLFQAMATGHATYSTVHADSAQSLIHRLEGKPINIPRVMLQSLDVVSLHIITRVKNKRARRCKQIIEIIDIDPTTKEILTNEVFRWDPVEDKFVFSGKSYILERIRAEKDLTRDEMAEEIKNRKTVVEWMNNTNIREFRDVAKVLSQYVENPGEVMSQVKKNNTKIKSKKELSKSND